AYDELTDPDGIYFWPEHKGRDGCRTPMVWEADSPNGGFSTADKTWLPVKTPQMARAVSEQGENSVLAFYRAMLALRRTEPDLSLGRTEFLDLPEPVLGFTRGDGFLCVFNLSPKAVSFALPEVVTPELQQGATVTNAPITLAGNGFVVGRRTR
ncbi:MAG: DUF3459 domain-containing protein, partial [Alphaproteobacteria bacterium]